MKKDFRDAVFGVIHELMRADPDIVVLNNDHGAFKLDEIKAEFPERTINVGVAEQNMMSLASGLAASGKKVFVYGIIAHLMRAWEQIKVGICIPNFPVTIIGTGAGLASGMDGPTHHGVEDVALMRVLANMTIYNPADWVCAEACMRMAYEARTPHYIRLDKHMLENIYVSGQDFSSGYIIRGAGLAQVIVSTGIETHRARRVWDQCTIDVYRLKPAPIITKYFPGKFVRVWDEHNPNGGLYSIVSQMFCSADNKSLDDAFMPPTRRFPLPEGGVWIDDGYGFPFNG